jgi:hypothetical protein
LLLAVDFYDRERIASWVRDHPGMIAWTREKIGQPIRGWRPYASWAAPGESTDAPYLLDDTSRLLDRPSPEEGAMPIAEGIHRLRSALAQPKGVVRLVGLSGMGKTRLAQALFDYRIEADGLDPALALYTDAAEPSDPVPADLMRRLTQNRQRAVILVDNCSPTTHRTLAGICKEHDSALSLITIEYDVSDDEPEGTEVFRLEPASNEVMEHLLELHAPHVSQVDRRRIAELCDGNARIALALAHTVSRGESIAALSDRVLFERLFYQRNEQDPSLLRAAEVCSLVYSFDGETLTGETMTVDQLYGCVTDLQSRHLIQRRGQWRAVLPQALAIRLAKNALERIPRERINAIFMERASDRLRKSFTRRLGYLHDSAAAQQIVRVWLSTEGILSNLYGLSNISIEMFRNIAPVEPEAALNIIERTILGEHGSDFLGTSNRERDVSISLLRSLAYNADQFERAALLLARFVAAEPPDYRDDNSRGRFLNLFQLYLSGTHASIDQRLRIVDALISSENARSVSSGLDALDALLEAWHFSSTYGFAFGARPRNYGWHPRTYEEVASWYRAAITRARQLALSEGPIADNARTILSKNFRGLWSKASMIDELDAMARALSAQKYWSEGWIAVRNTIRFDAADMNPEHARRLRALEEILRPNNLPQRVRSYVFSRSRGAFDIADGDPDEVAEDAAAAYIRADEVAERLGREVAQSRDVLNTLMPDLVRPDAYRGWQFGRGLAAGAESLDAMWQQLVDALIAVPEQERNVQVLRGFLSAAIEIDSEKTASFLDSALSHPVLGYWFPVLQTSFGVDQRGGERLEASLRESRAPSWTYEHLSYGRVMERIPAGVLHRLIIGITELPSGYGAAIHVFGMRLHLAQSSNVLLDDELKLCGRELILRYNFGRVSDNMLDYHLGKIANVCFQGPEASSEAVIVCRGLKQALLEYRAHPFDYKHLLGSLLRAQPLTVLDVFMGGRSGEGERLLGDAFRYENENPLDEVPDEVLITWAQTNPNENFVKLAAVIVPIVSTILCKLHIGAN